MEHSFFDLCKKLKIVVAIIMYLWGKIPSGKNSTLGQRFLTFSFLSTPFGHA